MNLSTQTIRILIADDHTLLRTAVAELLDTEDGLQVVAMAADAPEAVRLTRENRPDVVLLDIEMPGNEHPPTTVRALRHASPDVQILVLTMHDGPALVRSLLPLGIAGYLHKSVTHEALSAAVRSACRPGSPPTLSLSAAQLAAQHTPPPDAGPLSARETEVVQLVSQGLSNYQIARRLNIVEGTVKRHLRKIFDKLEARSRVEASNKAVELGVIAPPARPARWSRQIPIPIPPPTGSTAPVM